MNDAKTEVPWTAKFRGGELLPWKGEWFQVVGVGSDGLILKRKVWEKKKRAKAVNPEKGG